MPFDILFSNETFIDPDGDSLTYEIDKALEKSEEFKFDTELFTMDGNPKTIRLQNNTFPYYFFYSNALTVNVTAKDPVGEKVSQTLVLEV